MIEKTLNVFLSRKIYDLVYPEFYPGLNISEEILPSINSGNHKEVSLLNGIKSLWKGHESRHVLLTGEGGAGKTTSLLKLWEYLLCDDAGPVPVFIRLESCNHGEKKDFIWHFICRDYLDIIPSEENILYFYEYYRKPENKPSLILLLDGFNEITSDKTDLLLCLNDLRPLKGIQIIISSRYDMRNNFNWHDFTVFSLNALKERQIEDFIISHNMDYETIAGLSILKNPMMLSLYCNLDRAFTSASGEDYDFIESPCCKGEIIHNFITASLLRFDRDIILPEDRLLNRLYLKYLLPRTGYEMEKSGSFELSHRDFVDIIKDELSIYSSGRFLDLHPSVEYDMTERVREQLEPAGRQNIIKIIKLLREKYCLLTGKAGVAYSFLHQDFRDYFASVYIINKIKEGIVLSDNSFPELSKRPFEIHLRHMIGDLTGEARRRPVIENIYGKGEWKETCLDYALDLLRHREIPSSDYRIINIIEILKDKRVDLSDTDLSFLDLRQIVFNNVILGHGEGVNKGADLRGSRLKLQNFFCHCPNPRNFDISPDGERLLTAGPLEEFNLFTGHIVRKYSSDTGIIMSLCYSPDGNKVACASSENISEFDCLTGELIRTYEYNCSGAGFSSITFGPDSKSILSLEMFSGTITEWRNGSFVRTFADMSVSGAVYRNDGRKILSCGNRKIKEWDVETGIFTVICEKNAGSKVIYGNEADTVFFISHHEDQSRENLVEDPDETAMRIYRTFIDNIIIEADIKTGNYFKEYKGHTGQIHSIKLSPDGKKILSAAADRTVREWDIKTGECLAIYEGHKKTVLSALYTPDGKKILSGSNDGTIRIWDILTGECVKIFQYAFPVINSLHYNYDCSEIISIHKDNMARRWNILTGKSTGWYRSEAVDEICYGEDEASVVSVSVKGKTVKCNIPVGKTIRSYEGHSWPVKCTAAPSPDCRKIVSECEDRTIKEWDIFTGECIRVYSHHGARVVSITYSPDGKRILSSAMREITEWDVETGKCIGTYRGPGIEEFKFVCYSPDGNKFAAGCFDKILEWRRNEKKPFNVYEIDSQRIEWVNFIRYSLDGKKLLVVSGYDTIRELDAITGLSTFTGTYYPGLYVNSVNMSDLHCDSQVSEKERHILECYGAKVTGPPLSGKKDLEPIRKVLPP
ncbi:MAG: hypothetical protein ABRQ39_11160 [Candidatus Eremiobacterota bacterium]